VDRPVSASLGGGGDRAAARCPRDGDAPPRSSLTARSAQWRPDGPTLRAVPRASAPRAAAAPLLRTPSQGYACSSLNGCHHGAARPTTAGSATLAFRLRFSAMDLFDRGVVFQASLFLDPRRPRDGAIVAQAFAGRDLERSSQLALRALPTEQRFDQILLSGDGIAPQIGSALVWDNGVWRMSLAPNRFDVFMQARRYCELTGEALPGIAAFAERVRPALSTLSDAWPDVSRLVLASQCSGASADGAALAQRVARTFFSERIIQAAAASEVPDLSAQINHAASAVLSGTPVRVNRLQTVSARWTPTVSTIEWGTDFNTHPIVGKSFASSEAADFLKLAADWTAECHAMIEAA